MHGQQAGLPDAEDYDPDAIGTAELSAGDPEQTWEQYGLELVPVLHGGDDTGRRFIRRNGKYVADVSDEYHLLPNERVVSTANNVAQELGARPFHEFDGDWFVTLDDHVYQDPQRHRVHAIYAWEQGEIGGDDMEYGFAVHNSIDGSLAFSVSLFTFRHACQNMVHIGTGNARDRMAQNVESERGVIKKETHKHTKGLDIDPDALQALVKGNLTLVDDVDATYEEWLHEQVAPESIIDLVKRLPQKDLPEWVRDGVIDELDERVAELDAAESRSDLPPGVQYDVVEAQMPSHTNVWETYNDITEAIWHDSGTSDDSKRRKMKQTHRVFDPLAHQSD